MADLYPPKFIESWNGKNTLWIGHAITHLNITLSRLNKVHDSPNLLVRRDDILEDETGNEMGSAVHG